MKRLWQRFKHAWRWVKHANHIHYQGDLGNIVSIDEFWWGDVLIRECAYCRRRFCDFSSGLPDYDLANRYEK